MLVQSWPATEIKALSTFLDSSRQMEMTAVNQRYAQLWTFVVFVDPAALDAADLAAARVQEFNGLCEDLIGLENDIHELRGKGRPLREQLAERVIDSWKAEGGGSVPHEYFQELVQAKHRSEGPDLLEAMRKHLRSLMGETQPRLPGSEGGA